jgi:predicted ATPase/class 3 adenylate cyclase
MPGHPPSGTVTFLLTDLEGSTRLWEQNPEAMKVAMARHDELLERTIAAHRGYVFARMGDGMAASFSTARDAVCAASAVQQALVAERWRTERPLRARVGLHTDEATIVDDTGYANLPINRCSRLMTAAHGGQVVASAATEMLLRDQLPDGLELIDLGEHRLRDLGHPTRIFQLTFAGDREDFPALRTLDSFPGNLPAQVSSFIGREADVSRVTRALLSSRVVTITGVGGVGKTRLALQVAAEVLPMYRDGAWMVELAPVRDPDGVAEAVGVVFQTANQGASVEGALIEILRHKQLLLVLDNCEHVLGPVADLVTRIERECQAVAILATSREGLAIEGEQLLALPPLTLGDRGDDLTHQLGSDAVSLFVERARRVKADFALTQENSKAVVDVCRRLDGVPLAIELAAARVIALSPNELLRRLDRRFQVLSGGRRGAVERHATLRAAIDWSYELLSAPEQRLLARMAVFPGSYTLEAVEDVCVGDPVERAAVMDLVTGLVARSLVVTENHDVDIRFRLLETIRQYGDERLADWGETNHIVARHARFYAGVLARTAENFYGPEQLVLARRLNVERGNIRAALNNAIDIGDTTLAVRLAADNPNLQTNAATPMGEVLLIPATRVLEMPGAQDVPGYSRVLMLGAWLTLINGLYEEAEKLCQQALDAERRLAHPLPGPRIDVDAWVLKAHTALSIGAYDEAVTAYQLAGDLAKEDGYLGLASVYLAYCVSTAMLGGHTAEELVGTAEEAVTLARRSQMPGADVLSLNAMALTLVDRDRERAGALLDESIDRAATPGAEIPTGLLTACLVACRLRHWDLTLWLGARALYLWRWNNSLLQAATSFAQCARAFADERPEVAGVLQGAAYAAFHAAGSVTSIQREAGATSSGANFVLMGLRETGDIVAAALGKDRAREVRATGAAMNLDEAVDYALRHIDGRQPNRPIASIDR